MSLGHREEQSAAWPAGGRKSGKWGGLELGPGVGFWREQPRGGPTCRETVFKDDKSQRESWRSSDSGL